MAGRPQGKEARSVFIGVRVTKTGADTLDNARGRRSRAQFIRDAIAHYIRNGSPK